MISYLESEEQKEKGVLLQYDCLYKTIQNYSQIVKRFLEKEFSDNIYCGKKKFIVKFSNLEVGVKKELHDIVKKYRCDTTLTVTNSIIYSAIFESLLGEGNLLYRVKWKFRTGLWKIWYGNKECCVKFILPRRL